MTDLDELVAATRALEAEPSQDAGRRMWTKIAARTAVGVAAVSTVAAASSAAAGTSSSGVTGATALAAASTASTATAATAATAGVAMATKVGLGLALVAGLGVGTAYVTRSASPPAPTTTTAVDVSSPVMEATPAAPIAPPPEPDEPDEPDEVIVLELEPEAKPTTAAKPTPRASKAADSLAAESALLARARVAAAQGRSEAALANIRRHAKAYPATALAEVRQALEVRVLCDLGRVSQARAVGKRFMRSHGGSALAGQVRASCAFEDDDPAR